MKRKHMVHTFIFYDKETGVPLMSGAIYLPSLLKDGETFSVSVDPKTDEANFVIGPSADSRGNFNSRVSLCQNSIETKR